MKIIPYPLEIRETTRNMVWHPYSVRFDGPDGPGEFHIYAISDEHAYMRLQDVKENAIIVGRVVGMSK